MYNNAGSISGMIHLFPVHTFWGSKNSERRLLVGMSKEMQDDEAVFCLYSEMEYYINDLNYPCQTGEEDGLLQHGGLFHPGDPNKVMDLDIKALWYERCKIGGAKTIE